MCQYIPLLTAAACPLGPEEVATGVVALGTILITSKINAQSYEYNHNIKLFVCKKSTIIKKIMHKNIYIYACISCLEK